MVDAWNGLGPEFVRPGNGVRREPLTSSLISRWHRIHREQPELAAALLDPPRVVAAIKQARFVHCQGFFSLQWLLGKVKNDDRWALEKVLSGAYGDSEVKPPARSDGGLIRGGDRDAFAAQLAHRTRGNALAPAAAAARDPVAEPAA
jgi:hypothetical protein